MMSGHSSTKERRKRREQRLTPFESKASSTMVPSANRQHSTTGGMSISIPKGPQSYVAAAPTQASSISPGQLMSATTTTTTTTTTHQTGQQSGLQSSQNAQPGADALTNRLQNMHIQQGSIEQHTPVQGQQLLPPSIVTPTRTPQSQQQPLPHLSTKPRAATVPDPTPSVKQTQSSKYPVTAELRTTAFLQWRSSHTSKPQRAIDRMKDDYTSGRKDKEIYETWIKQQQALQAQTQLELSQSVQNLGRKQQRAAREQRRQELEAERRAAETESRQTQQDFQLRRSAQELEHQLQKTVNRQKREDRQREREAREQREAYEQQIAQQQHLYQMQQQQQQIALQQQASHQQHFLQNTMGGQSGFGHFGGGPVAGVQTITTVEIAQIVTQLGVGSESGESRKNAIARGGDAIQQLEHRIQTSLSQLGVCPVGFQWVPTAGASGYMCCGGNHFISDHEIDKFLADSFYIPVHNPCNSGLVWMELNGMTPPDVPLKKPPDQLPKTYQCWSSYEGAKMRKEWEASGQQAGLWNPGMPYGF